MKTEIDSPNVSSIAKSETDHLPSAKDSKLGFRRDYRDNIEGLEEQYEKLKDVRERVEKNINTAQRNGENIFSDVEKWIGEVGKISEETSIFLEREINAGNGCCDGLCSKPTKRNRLSEKAREKTLAISDLLERAEKFENVAYRAFSGTFESRESIKKDIMEALKDDNVSIIGIYGMVGVGKTTLVKEIGKQAKEDKIYDSVVMAVVSKIPSIKNIQREIAKMLGRTLPDHLSQSDRALDLRRQIEQKERILIILDNVWSRLELDDIGIPFGQKDHPGCKIVLTTRSEIVCDQMDCQKKFPVGTLTKQESRELFKELAGVNPIAGRIADKCGDLPIAIVMIARALKNKDMDKWIDADQQLGTPPPTNIEGIPESVISSLELSYSSIEPEAQSLFLFCSLFPEDYYILTEDLVRYGKGLRWFEDLETIKDVRFRTHAFVSTLISSFLLIAGEGCYENCVKMPDFVRDVAQILEPKYNKTFMVKAGVSLGEWPSRGLNKEFTAISLMSNDIRELPDCLVFPKLQTLLLQGNRELVIPDSFFEGMADLRVLDLGQTKLSPLPKSLCSLVNLRTLYLDSCKLDDLSVIGGLSNLEILSLHGSNIKEIPTSFSQLNHLRLLDLSKCHELKSIGVISSLKLEELYK